MRNKRNQIVNAGFIVMVLGLSLVACNDKNSSGSARLEVRLTDAPGDYQEVNIDVQEVQVNSQGGSPNSGWQSLSINKGVYNLLKLSNGLDTLLGHIDLPTGKVSQIRFILGDNNTIKINNQFIALNTPSAQQSGLKFQVNAELKEGITYKILVDFDAARSIVATGNGKFNLKPVIRTITEAENGAIKGSVNPVASTPVVYAIAGTDTVSTFANTTTGKFLVRGLAARTYRLVLVPKAGFQPTEKPNVSVTLGNVTDVGTITIK